MDIAMSDSATSAVMYPDQITSLTDVHWCSVIQPVNHHLPVDTRDTELIQINSNELHWPSFTILVTKTLTLVSCWRSAPSGCPGVSASWRRGLLMEWSKKWCCMRSQMTYLISVIACHYLCMSTLMSFALHAPCPGANDKDYIVGVNMCQPSIIHPGVLL